MSNSLGQTSLTLPGGRSERQRPRPDGVLLVVTMVLALLGLVMVFSASAIVADSRYHDPGYFLKRQLAWLGLGVLLLHLASRVDYLVWQRATVLVVGLTVLLLVLVLVPSIGVAAKGARRWLRLGLVSVQPAELAKLTVVLYLASYLARKDDRLRGFRTGFLRPLLVVSILCGLVILERDFGTVVIIGLVSLGLVFLAGARPAHLLSVLLAGIPTAAALVLSSPYRRQRLLTFLEPWKDPTDAGFQMTQSLLAFGSGGLFGVGLGEGKQKLFFLPEAHTDFVLALLGEELGLAGTAAVILLFGLFVLKGFQIAGQAHSAYGFYLAAGLTLLVGVEALVNAGVVTGLLPTKGLTLPLVSYGGSSLLVTLLAVGMLMSVSRDRQGGDAGVRSSGGTR